MKYRSGQNKIKQEHGMIKGLKVFLKELQGHDFIDSMIPGPIKPVKKAIPQLKIRRLMPTQTGLKAIIQSGAAVQEVFFVGDSEQMREAFKPYLLK